MPHVRGHRRRIPGTFGLRSTYVRPHYRRPTWLVAVVVVFLVAALLILLLLVR